MKLPVKINKLALSVTDHSDKFNKRARLLFVNGYVLSVLRGPYSYGGDEGLYEVAVMHNGILDCTTPLTDSVIGYCTEEDVLKYAQQLKEFAEAQ